MVIISKTVINDFCQLHPDATDAFLDWYKKTKQADWSTLNELKVSFLSADYVGNDLYVFNIRGNKYRLIVRTFFNIRTVFIRFIGTHTEYDKVDLNDL